MPPLLQGFCDAAQPRLYPGLSAGKHVPISGKRRIGDHHRRRENSLGCWIALDQLVCIRFESSTTKFNLWRLQMRQLLALSVLLLGVSWAAAQDTSSQTNPSPSTPTQTTAGQATSGQSSANASGETSVQGCLSGANGSYTLTDASGATYQLTGDTSKLSNHVNQEVKVTGASAAGSSAPASGDGSAASTTGQAGAASQQTLQVSAVKQVSKTCQSGAAAH
jgi:hypothetical protein